MPRVTKKGSKWEMEDSLPIGHCSLFLLLKVVAICGLLLSDLRLPPKEGGVTYRRTAGAKGTRDL